MRYLLGLLLLLTTSTVLAQELTEEDYYYPYASFADLYPEPEPLAADSLIDRTLYYRAIRTAEESYEAATRFTLPRVRLERRGEPYGNEEATLYGAPVAYRYRAMLRRMGVEEHYLSGISLPAEGVGGTGGVHRMSFSDELPNRPDRLSLHYADRNYRVGVRAVVDRLTRHDWRWVAAADLRTGRDASIDGLFTQSANLGGRLSKRWKNELQFDLFAALPISVQGLRSASTEEAYNLTGDRWYNPAWGLQGGEVRNSRVRREVLPMVVASVAMPLTPSTRLRLTGSAEAGISRQSSLGWYDARTPYPDNYRYMPSYTADVASDAAWRRRDVRYTQVNWDELIAQNRLREGEAAYALEDRVKRPLHLLLRAAFESKVGEVELNYGLSASWKSERRYKQMRDLLGAEYLTDIDYYLIDDATYHNRLENNLRSPSRRIGEGDRFGYDYRFEQSRIGGWVGASWQYDRWQVSGAAEMAEERIRRRGFYEKELFPGNGSLGPSPAIALTTYALKGAVGYAFSPSSELSFTFALGSRTPYTDHLFIQPQYNNRTIEKPKAERYSALQLLWRRRSDQLWWQVAAYLTASFDGVESGRYYDDLAGLFCDMTVSSLARRTMGIEAVVGWQPSFRWRLEATLAATDCRYVRDAEVTVLSDVDNQPIDSKAVSRLGGCRPGAVPSFTASLKADCYLGRGWRGSLSTGVAMGRYVDPSPLRRTDRVVHQAGSTPESFDLYTIQERLSDCLTVDFSLFKSFIFENESELYLALHLQNLLNGEMISYGYESVRSQRIGAGDAAMRVPQPSRYLYALPRSIVLTVGYRF